MRTIKQVKINTSIPHFRNPALKVMRIILTAGIILSTTACNILKHTFDNYDKRARFKVVSNIYNPGTSAYMMLKGYIIDIHKIPLIGATIHLPTEDPSHKNFVLSDIDGKFSCQIKESFSGEEKIKISYIGFRDAYIKLKEIENTEIEITLFESVHNCGD